MQNRDDLTVLMVEDESVDAEVLVTDGEWRDFVKIVAACDRASRFAATIVDEATARGRPRPTLSP